MMRWWLDRGVDGFRMDVINMISKDPGAARRAVPDGRYGDGGRTTSAARASTSSCRRCTARCSPAGDALLTVGEMPGVTVEEARLFTDPARGEVDMVFQFEHVDLDQGATKWDVAPAAPDRPQGARSGAGRRGWPSVGWNSLYWNNHDQPRIVSRFGDDGEYRVRSAKMLGTVLHLHRGTPYVYQGEELGMTNAPFAGIDDFRDIESLNHYAEARRGRRRPGATCSRDAGR